MSFQILNISIDGKQFEISKNLNSRSNVITVLTGKNGTGKSRLLEFIASNFKISANFLQKHPNNWDKNFNTLLESFQKNQILYKLNGNDILAKIVAKGLACGFIFKGEEEDWRLVFPQKLVCISTSPFDRFPLNSTSKESYDDFYSYIGMKRARKGNSVQSLISNVVEAMFKKPSSLKTNIGVMKTTLEYLGYGKRILVTYTIPPKVNLFPITIENVNSAINQLMSDHAYDNELELENCVSEIYNSLIYLKENNNIETKKTFSIPLNLSKENTLENDYIKAIQVLSSTGFLKIKSLKLSEKSDNRKFLNFANASSGEQCLALMLLGVASQIEDNSLICIDEPEISLHPEWQEEFIPLLQNLFNSYKGCHFIIATHSPLIISKLNSINCFTLDLDNNELININNTTNRSADYQLATLFKSPGFKNEYLINECLDILSHLSKSVDITPTTKRRAEFLLSITPLLDKEDPVYSLVSTIQQVLSEL